MDVLSNQTASSTARLVWHVVPSDHTPDVSTSRLQGCRVVIVGGESATAPAVAAQLSCCGCMVRTVSLQHDATAESAILRELGSIDAIVDLNIAGAFAIEDAVSWEAPLLQSVRVLKACYARWQEESNAERLGYLAVTRMGGHMGYGPGHVVQPLGGLWAGLAKTLPQELPNCNVKIVDLSEADYANAAEIVARELYDWGRFEVGWIDGVRHALAAQYEQAACDLPDLSGHDTVLLSGGARGIGLKLACHLSRERHCRVIVTGRHALPDSSVHWAHMDEAAFRRYEWQELRAAARTETVRSTRERLGRERTIRELVQNLRDIETAGLAIEYRQCDVTSWAQVSALVESVASSLAIVVHNAGIDLPVRLPAKSNDAILRTVRTKVIGFVNLLRAVERVPLRLFCNVGSLTGRWGGMTGEVDYAAANECLSRLGRWAAEAVPFPVKTICWPTWDRVGMIKNFAVTRAYMSPLDVREGLEHWHRELRSSSPAEVTYSGTVGTALTPIQLNGFPPIAGMPQIENLYSRRHYLGRVVSFRPHHSMRSECTVNVATAPLLSDFMVDGVTSMPVSMLLEYAIAGAEWIRPTGRPDLKVHEIRDVECRLHALRAPAGVYAFSRELRGTEAGDDWIVNVAIATSDGQSALRASLVFRPHPPLNGDVVPLGDRGTRSVVVNSMLRWRGTVFALAEWTMSDEGVWTATVVPSSPLDAWATVVAPAVTLPAAHLENAIRAAAGRGSTAAGCETLHIAAIRFFHAGQAHTVIGNPDVDQWQIVDDQGRLVIVMERLGFLPKSLRKNV